MLDSFKFDSTCRRELSIVVEMTLRIFERPLDFVRISVALCISACGQSSTYSLPPKATTTASLVDVRGPTSNHHDALGRLHDAFWGTRTDRFQSISLPMPDAEAWTHVRFWGLSSLAGWRYGSDHHAVAVALVFPMVKELVTLRQANADRLRVESCAQRFERWAHDWAKAFDMHAGEPHVEWLPWQTRPSAEIQRVVFDAEQRSLFGSSRYAAAYAVYPAWPDVCLVIGYAVPARDDNLLAQQVRSRIVHDAFTAVVVKPNMSSIVLEAKTNIEE